MPTEISNGNLPGLLARASRRVALSELDPSSRDSLRLTQLQIMSANTRTGVVVSLVGVAIYAQALSNGGAGGSVWVWAAAMLLLTAAYFLAVAPQQQALMACSLPSTPVMASCGVFRPCCFLRRIRHG
jgi:multisubunit Na+/H+ antiporter MnhG subunit